MSGNEINRECNSSACNKPWAYARLSPFKSGLLLGRLPHQKNMTECNEDGEAKTGLHRLHFERIREANNKGYGITLEFLILV